MHTIRAIHYPGWIFYYSTNPNYFRHWYWTLTSNIDIKHWHITLTLYIDIKHWYQTLALNIDIKHWHWPLTSNTEWNWATTFGEIYVTTHKCCLDWRKAKKVVYTDCFQTKIINFPDYFYLYFHLGCYSKSCRLTKKDLKFLKFSIFSEIQDCMLKFQTFFLIPPSH